MPTQYDVFAEIIARAPLKPKDLPFTKPIYSHINALEKKNWIKKERGSLTPIKNKETEAAFKIIKYCLNNGLNYNVFFSRNIAYALSVLAKKVPKLRPKELSNNKDLADLLGYLEKHQFILVEKNRPKIGLLLQHQLLEAVAKLHNQPIQIKQFPPGLESKQDVVLAIRTAPLNPFDQEVFSFLAGSAQLEGSTVTEGETIDIILKDIYPAKPQKDIQMVKNLHKALQYMFEHIDEKITSEHIQKINEQILFTLHQGAGKYKKTQNKIQGNPAFKTARPEEAALLVEQYCEFLGKISTKNECLQMIGLIHNNLHRIHPFADGNSRTTRMIVNWMLLKHSLPLLVLKMGAFDTYMNLTKLAAKRDDVTLQLFIERVLLHENLIN